MNPLQTENVLSKTPKTSEYIKSDKYISVNSLTHLCAPFSLHVCTHRANQLLNLIIFPQYGIYEV